MTTYNKPHLTFTDQVRLLKGRGLLVEDEQEAKRTLGVIGYYRLSGYWHSYRRTSSGSGREDRFAPGTTLRQVVRLYEADRRLKLQVLHAVERVEIALRVRIGFTLGLRGAYAHLDPANLDGQFTSARGGQCSAHTRWLGKVTAAQSRSSEDFVRHFHHKYDGRLPVWVVTEILDFGSLRYLFKGLKTTDRDAIAGALEIRDRQGRGNGAALSNWLRVLNYVRNVSAHHSRLWNRNLVDQIAPSHLRFIPELDHLARLGHSRIYSTLCILGFLLARIEQPTVWAVQIRRLLDTEIAGSGRHLAEMGFPADWADHHPWKDMWPWM